MNTALYDILSERKNLNDKWGTQNHNAGKWLLILQEEIGEFSQRILNNESKGFGCSPRDELVQVAAVALAMVESYDRSYCR